MNMKKLLIAIAVSALFLTCKEEKKEPQIPVSTAKDSTQLVQKNVPFVWQGANIYFLWQNFQYVIPRIFRPKCNPHLILSLGVQPLKIGKYTAY